mmetsp:Transcript_25516/g.64333  ORF Transcript_25516/g.64333 Transcript_25516/m.64333 type:complete len:254 (+) Transcript_25516:1-762(+)
MGESEWADAMQECLEYEARGGGGGLEGKAGELLRCRRKVEVQKEIARCVQKVKNSKLHAFKEELRGRTRVLRRMQYVDEEGMVTVKGRCACEVEISQDLVAVEMMLAGAFIGVDPADIAAVVSCLVVEEKDDSAGHLQEFNLKPLLEQISESRRAIYKAQAKAGLSQSEPEAVNTCLMDLIHAWCKGAEFSELCKQTNLFEGSIIRAMRREAELLRQMVSGAAAIGDSEMEKKFEEALAQLQRGLPFSASLYL